jgi:hypothetical protein
MAYLVGHSRGAGYVQAPQGAYANGAVNAVSPTTNMPAVIDGTPVRIVVLALSAAAGLVALHWAGFRFQVGVSG